MALQPVRVRARPMEIAAAYPYNEHVPRGYELFSVAAAGACHLLQEGFAADKLPEARLRQCFIQGLLDSGDVIPTTPELGGNTELQPALPEWPNKPGSALGGLDLAVRVYGDYSDSWRYLAELKWDALWMQLWDAYKLPTP